MNIYPNLLNKQLYKVPIQRTARWETVDFIDVDTSFEIKEFPLLADTVRNVTDNIDKYGKITVTPTDVLSFYCDTSKYIEGVYEEGYGSDEAPFVDINYALSTIWCILNKACFKVKAVLHIVNDVTTNEDISGYNFYNCLLIDGLGYNGENCKLTCKRMFLSGVRVRNLDIKSSYVLAYSIYNCNVEAIVTNSQAHVYATLIYKSKIIGLDASAYNDIKSIHIYCHYIIESDISDKQFRIYVEAFILKKSKVYAHDISNYATYISNVLQFINDTCIIANSEIIAVYVSGKPAIVFKCTAFSGLEQSNGCCIVDCTINSNSTNGTGDRHNDLLMLNATLHADNASVRLRYMENSTLYRARNFYMNGGMRGSSVTMAERLYIHDEIYPDTEYVYNDSSFAITLSNAIASSADTIIVNGGTGRCTEVRNITVDILGDNSLHSWYDFMCTSGVGSELLSQVTINVHLNTMKVSPAYSSTYGDTFVYSILGKPVGSPCQVNFIGEVVCVGEHKTQLFRTALFSTWHYLQGCGVVGIEKYDEPDLRSVTVYDGVKRTQTKTYLSTGETTTDVKYLCEQPDDGSDDE